MNIKFVTASLATILSVQRSAGFKNKELPKELLKLKQIEQRKSRKLNK